MRVSENPRGLSQDVTVNIDSSTYHGASAKTLQACTQVSLGALTVDDEAETKAQRDRIAQMFLFHFRDSVYSTKTSTIDIEDIVAGAGRQKNRQKEYGDSDMPWLSAEIRAGIAEADLASLITGLHVAGQDEKMEQRREIARRQMPARQCK